MPFRSHVCIHFNSFNHMWTCIKNQDEYFQSRGHLWARTGSIGIAGKPRTFFHIFGASNHWNLPVRRHSLMVPSRFGNGLDEFMIWNLNVFFACFCLRFEDHSESFIIFTLFVNCLIMLASTWIRTSNSTRKDCSCFAHLSWKYSNTQLSHQATNASFHN